MPGLDKDLKRIQEEYLLILHGMHTVVLNTVSVLRNVNN